MNLYVLRHAAAVPRGTRSYRRDSDRPLTKDGVNTMRRAARGMYRLKLDFDLILSSPYVRARQTAEITADVFAAKKQLKLSGHLASDGDPRKLVAELNRDYPTLGSILIVGHEPYLSELICVLIGCRSGTALALKKGGLGKLSTDSLRFGPCAKLDWLVTPRQLVRIGKA
ncbi:MAG TPA: phosphohistidine phosphatase SixA [Verrucomicrobiae bacterium]|nr:phosphohistidine phosphatase SixA [Verrucomicrobiae bacterium]